MIRATMMVAAAVAVLGCGGAKSSSSHNGFAGTATIQGAPHGGSYAACLTSPATGGIVTVTCSGLPSCDDCGLVFGAPVGGGATTCAAGTAGVQINDPSIPDPHAANAGCSASVNPVGPNPNCPGDSATGCNNVLGDCAVETSNAVPADTGANPFGHFSGSFSATVWTGSKLVACTAKDGETGVMQQAPDGDSYSITFTGGW